MKPAFFHRDCQKLEEFEVLLLFSIKVFGSGDEQLKVAHENIRENRGSSGAVLQQNPGYFLKKKLSKFREWKKKFLNKLNVGMFGNSKCPENVESFSSYISSLGKWGRRYRENMT
jgi:hypothetical protein